MVDGPLNGIRVLDLTHVWAGPLAVRFLADLGAEVVKVEAPTGRGPRVYPSAPIGGWLGGEPYGKPYGEPYGEPWNTNAIFAKLHRNRRSLCIDLKQDAGRAAFLELVRVADVVIENFSARAMPSAGLDYTTLCEANPEIIYVTMPGFGASGPYSDRVAFGPTIEAMSGLTTMLGYDAETPRNSAMALVDPIGATHAAAAVVAALRERLRDGRGCCVELSLHEAGVSYSGPWLIARQLLEDPTCIGNRHPGMSPHGIYPCAGDDQWLALACADDTQWAALCRLLDLPEGSLESCMDLRQRIAEADHIDDLIARWTQKRSKHAATESLQAAGVAAGPVNTVPDMTRDEQVMARGFFVPYEAFGTPMPGNPMRMAGLDSAQWTPCPRLGADNHEVLTEWLGYDTAHVTRLEADGVLADKPPD